MKLKKKSLTYTATSGVLWVASSNVGAQVLNFGTSVLLARLLLPSDFGRVAMVTVLTGFVALFADFGLGAALVQQPGLTDVHKSSAFWLNVAVGLVLAGLAILGAPAIAAFYGDPGLVQLTRGLAIGFVIGPMGAVHQATLTRSMLFKKLAVVHVVGVLVGGAVGVALAVVGFGVWSLVWKSVATTAASVVTLWLFSAWRPKFVFALSAARGLLKFGGNLVLANSMNYGYRNADNVLVGRFLGAADLGVYSRAYSLMLLPVSQVTTALGRVMFPALSQIREDSQRVSRAYLRALGIIALVTFPLMLGLASVCNDFVATLYGHAWMDVVPVLRVFCFLGLIQSVTSSTGWIYMSQGRTDLMLRWRMIAGPFIVGSFALGVYIGTVEAVALCYTVVSGAVLSGPGLVAAGRLVGVRLIDVLRTIAPASCCAGVMGIVVWAIGSVLPVREAWLRLTILVAVGGAIYVSLIIAGRVAAFQDLRQVLHARRRREASNQTERLR